MPRFKRIHIIINPASGGDEPILNIFNDVLTPYGVEWDVSITKTMGDGERFARAAIDDGVDLVVVYGGDGTVLDVVKGMIGRKTPLAIMHGGTANAMADEVGIPFKLSEAAQLIIDDEAILRPIDVGKTGRGYFLIRVGTGMVATITKATTRELKNRFGIAAYIIGGIQALTNPEYVHYRLEIDGEVVETDGAACLVTNASYVGTMGLRLANDIVVDDGLLDVYILNNDLKTVLGMAGSIANIDRSRLSLQHWRCKEVKIDCDPVQGLYGDGEPEPLGTTPCYATVLPGAIKVLVPKSSIPQEALNG